MPDDVLHIGLPDVALLARVQRPPVSMWRKRFAASHTPFPEPVHMRGTQPFFDAAAVVKWLETTGRGRNPDARADLAAFAVLGGTSADDPVVFAGLTALLCLSGFGARLAVDPDDIEDLADDVDPDDAFLYSEIVGLGARLAPMARYATLLIDAAGHATTAFESLMNRRTRRPGSGHARTAVAAPALRLAARLALALGTHAEIATPCYVDPTPGGSDLIVELSRYAPEWGGVAVATPDVDSVEGRLARRRFRVHDIARTVLPCDGDGGFSLPDGAVVLMQLPAPDRPELTDGEVVAQINDVVLGAAAAQFAVVVGPASALTDRLRGEAAQVRTDVLRTNRVRGIVRLPTGLLPGKPRARLALWCVGPLPLDADVPRTLVADLADVTLDDTAIAELVTDLVAGVRSGRPWLSHTPRFTQAQETHHVTGRLGDLVEPQPAEDRSLPAAAVDRVNVLRHQLGAPPPAFDPPAPQTRESTRNPTLTLGAAVASGALARLPGARIGLADLDEAGSVRVISLAAVIGTGPAHRIDRLVLAARYPAARFTEPGDVVFATAPRPAALVDTEGGAVAAFPARILRTRSVAFVPRVLAADINAQPAVARTWRAWNVRTVPDDQAEALTDMLDALDRHRHDLADRIALLDEFAAALVSGTAVGTFDLR